MARGRDKFNKFKTIINMIAKAYSFLPKNYQVKALVRHRNQTGNLGIVIRYALLKNLAHNLGDNVSVMPGVYLFNIDNLSIGSNVSIHPMTYIEAYGGISIGNNVSIAHSTTLMSVTHNFSELDLPIKDQGVTGKSIVIEDNVWIGAKVTVLGGTTIKSGSVIGAGAVVTKDIENNSIAVGVPAKSIKHR